MSVLIKGMEMPKACVYRENGHFMTCPLYDVDGYCGALNREAKHDLETKLCDCPLIPVPDHGRLIDADAYIAYCGDKWIPLNIDAVNAQPTIISAELPKEDDE